MIWLTIIIAALPVEVRWSFETEQGHNEGTVVVGKDAWDKYQVAVSATGEYIPSTKGIVAALYAGVDSPFPSEYLTYTSKCDVTYRKYDDGVLGPIYAYETEVPSAEGGPEQLHVIDGYQYIDQNARIFNINQGTRVRIEPCNKEYQISLYGMDYCTDAIRYSDEIVTEITGKTTYCVNTKSETVISYECFNKYAQYDIAGYVEKLLDYQRYWSPHSAEDGHDTISVYYDLYGTGNNVIANCHIISRWIFSGEYEEKKLSEQSVSELVWALSWPFGPGIHREYVDVKVGEMVSGDKRQYVPIVITNIIEEYNGVNLYGDKTKLFKCEGYCDRQRIVEGDYFYTPPTLGVGYIYKKRVLYSREIIRMFVEPIWLEVNYNTGNCNLVYIDNFKQYKRATPVINSSSDAVDFSCEMPIWKEQTWWNNKGIVAKGNIYIEDCPIQLEGLNEINRVRGIEEYPFLVKAEEILGNIGSHVNVSEQELSNLIEGFVGSGNEEKWGDIEDSWRDLIVEYQELQDIKEYQLSNDYLINIGEVTEIGTRVGVWETEMAAVKGLIEEYQNLLWRNSRYEEWHLGNRADVVNTYSSQFKGQVLEELDSMELSVITMLSGISGLEIDKKDGLLGALNEVLIQIGVLKFGYESFADVSYDIEQLQQSINTVDSELRGVIEDWFLGWDSELTTMKSTLSSIVEAQGALDENIGSLTAAAVADRLYSGTQSFLEGLSYETEVNESSSVGFMGSLPEMELNVSGGEEIYVLSFDVLGNQYSFSLQPSERIMGYLEVLRLVINVLMTGKFMVFCYKLVKGI